MKVCRLLLTTTNKYETHIMYKKKLIHEVKKFVQNKYQSNTEVQWYVDCTYAHNQSDEYLLL